MTKQFPMSAYTAPIRDGITIEDGTYPVSHLMRHLHRLGRADMIRLFEDVVDDLCAAHEDQCEDRDELRAKHRDIERELVDELEELRTRVRNLEEELEYAKN